MIIVLYNKTIGRYVAHHRSGRHYVTEKKYARTFADPKIAEAYRETFCPDTELMEIAESDAEAPVPLDLPSRFRRCIR